MREAIGLGHMNLGELLYVDDGNYALIGPLVAEASFLLLPSGEVAGLELSLFQQGGIRPDDGEIASAFDTVEEAVAAGVDYYGGNIAWGANGLFDTDGEPLRHADYMSYMGD